MQINTKPYGPVTINEEDIIFFENGLIGFEASRKFVLLGNRDANETLIWLQSIDTEDLAFVVIQPPVVKPDYKPAIRGEEIEELEADNASDLLVYSIVTIPEEIKKMTVNLKAPVIINVKNNKGKQIILNDDKYAIKELVFTQN